MFRSHASQKELSLFGKFASTISVAIALAIGILWKQGLSALTQINFPINMQAVSDEVDLSDNLRFSCLFLYHLFTSSSVYCWIIF